MNKISSKLWEAHSRLYQNRILQPNTHFATFFEIYKICKPLRHSKFKKRAKEQNEYYNIDQWICHVSDNSCWTFIGISRIFVETDKLCRESDKILSKTTIVFRILHIDMTYTKVIWLPHVCHYNPLLIRTGSWILTIHKAKGRST